MLTYMDTQGAKIKMMILAWLCRFIDLHICGQLKYS